MEASRSRTTALKPWRRSKCLISELEMISAVVRGHPLDLSSPSPVCQLHLSLAYLKATGDCNRFVASLLKTQQQINHRRVDPQNRQEVSSTCRYVSCTATAPKWFTYELEQPFRLAQGLTCQEKKSHMYAYTSVSFTLKRPRGFQTDKVYLMNWSASGELSSN